MHDGCSDSKVITFDLDSCLLTAKAASTGTEPRQRGHSSPTIPPTIERAALPRILMERRLDSFGQPVVDAPIHPFSPHFTPLRATVENFSGEDVPSPLVSSTETSPRDRFLRESRFYVSRLLSQRGTKIKDEVCKNVKSSYFSFFS